MKELIWLQGNLPWNKPHSGTSLSKHTKQQMYILLVYCILLYYVTQVDITYKNVHEYVRLEVNPFLWNLTCPKLVNISPLPTLLRFFLFTNSGLGWSFVFQTDSFNHFLHLWRCMVEYEKIELTKKNINNFKTWNHKPDDNRKAKLNQDINDPTK